MSHIHAFGGAPGPTLDFSNLVKDRISELLGGASKDSWCSPVSMKIFAKNSEQSGIFGRARIQKPYPRRHSPVGYINKTGEVEPREAFLRALFGLCVVVGNRRESARSSAGVCERGQ